MPGTIFAKHWNGTMPYGPAVFSSVEEGHSPLWHPALHTTGHVRESRVKSQRNQRDQRALKPLEGFSKWPVNLTLQGLCYGINGCNWPRGGLPAVRQGGLARLSKVPRWHGRRCKTSSSGFRCETTAWPG
ncbi:hypothetical protein CTAM01_16084 [Colletotrichum tamarilloi]|uniref:Uncharacterized protein n=1 Tax=Colletotrichum tamarilloi TaxID=1209934 RepID=A0ABQ9QJJ0_9PEZI|nr:uncharacterized protein CTAM01_16084 [Colletotrichum tamarilloi]KAK1473846.1 hypothetical protein CTAM01_16084 [Colletotrichum tamarilloi]